MIRFCTPCLDHKVAIEYLMSALHTERLLLARSVAHEWCNRPGDPFVAKARSTMVAEFLASKGTDLFFLDDDLGWPAEKVLEFIDRDEPVLAGVYPQKLDEISFPCSVEMGEDGGLIERDGLVKAVLVPTGFLRIKRWVLEKLWDEAPPYRETDASGKVHECRAVFNSGPAADGQWWGEDFAFSNSCQIAGIDMWIDPAIPFYHRGAKRYGAQMSHSLDVFRDKARKMKDKAA